MRRIAFEVAAVLLGISLYIGIGIALASAG